MSTPNLTPKIDDMPRAAGPNKPVGKNVMKESILQICDRIAAENYENRKVGIFSVAFAHLIGTRWATLVGKFAMGRKIEGSESVAQEGNVVDLAGEEGWEEIPAEEADELQEATAPSGQDVNILFWGLQ